MVNNIILNKKGDKQLFIPFAFFVTEFIACL